VEFEMSSSPNTQIKPVSFQSDTETNVATVGGLSFETLAKTYGTPLYILDEQTLRQMMGAYKDAFREYPAPVKVLFAAKANLCMGLCALVQQEGLGLDVVSGGEYYTALKARFPVEDIVFNGNNKTREELELVISNGIGRISLDNFHELNLIHDIADRLGKKVPVVLRVTPGIECHTHDYIKTGHLDSKFGFDLTQLSNAIERVITDYPDTIELTGLHAHIGSQIFETRPYHDLVEVMMNLFYNIREHYGVIMTHLNLGGGLGVVYQEGDDPPQVADYAKVVIDKLVAYAEQIDFPLPTLILEPGRSLVATAGLTLYTVGSIKTIPELNKTYVAVDGGMGDNIRPALYGAVYTAMVINKPNEPHTKKVTIAGKYCESGDILIKEFMAPESIAPGDKLLVFGTGAYNYSMSSNYNRVPRPAVVMVNKGQAQTLVQPETYDDIISHDLIPEALLSSQSSLSH
jgi:diaminopimelate decarboxylase